MAALLCSASGVWTFIGSSLAPRPPATPCRAAGEGFGDDAPKREKSKKQSVVTQEQLQADHGDKWELVDKILKGKKAENPEAMMRARFTALRFKDTVFLAATEQDENVSQKKRAEVWAMVLGLQQRGVFDSILAVFSGGSNYDSLSAVKKFEVVDASGSEVEFKITCANGKVLHERSKMVADKRWGFVYAGDSVFQKWE